MARLGALMAALTFGGPVAAQLGAQPQQFGAQPQPFGQQQQPFAPPPQQFGAPSQVSVAGQWQCEHTSQPFNGDQYSLHMWSYTLWADQNGNWQLQGVYRNPIIGADPVQGQGTYSGPRPGFGDAEVIFQGTMWRGGEPMPYVLAGKFSSPQNFYFQFTGPTSISNMACQR